MFKKAKATLSAALASLDQKLDERSRCGGCGHSGQDAPVMNLDDPELNDYCLCREPFCICNPLATAPEGSQ